MRYIVNSSGPSRPMPPNMGFWQGNFRSPLDSYDAGFRFESIDQFLGMLCMDAMEKERLERVAVFERERASKH